MRNEIEDRSVSNKRAMCTRHTHVRIARIPISAVSIINNNITARPYKRIYTVRDVPLAFGL